MSQPFSADSFIYSHKGLLKDNYPTIITNSDTISIYNWPKRYYVSVFKFKLYDLDAIMHIMQWNDMTIDYQT
jgi:hypothetical protein